MKLLLLGGTRFVGRWICDVALERGHQVTIFTRGLTNSDAVPGAEHLRGDRMSDASSLKGRSFDAVIDSSAYHPRAVTVAGESIRAGHYVFISTLSVYADASKRGSRESDALADPPSPLPDEFVPEQYGPLKVACEREAARLFGDRLAVVRPGLIAGPLDYSDRFTYWPARAARGGDMLVPGPADRPVQLIDARDLAAWTLDLAERSATGIFNATGPAEPITMADVIEACVTASESDARAVWTDPQWLVEQGVQEWSDMPLWLRDDGLMTASNASAVVAGLSFRPLLETTLDTLAWDRTRDPGPRAAGLTSSREAELLSARTR